MSSHFKKVHFCKTYVNEVPTPPEMNPGGRGGITGNECSVGVLWQGTHGVGVHTGQGSRRHSYLFLPAILVGYRLVPTLLLALMSCRGLEGSSEYLHISVF